MNTIIDAIFEDTEWKMVLGNSARVVIRAMFVIFAGIFLLIDIFALNQIAFSVVGALMVIFGWWATGASIILEFNQTPGYLTVTDYKILGLQKRVNKVPLELALHTRKDTNIGVAANASTYTLYRVFLPISQSEATLVYSGPDFQKQAYVERKIIERINAMLSTR